MGREKKEEGKREQKWGIKEHEEEEEGGRRRGKGGRGIKEHEKEEEGSRRRGRRKGEGEGEE